jgi:hypothetical protein
VTDMALAKAFEQVVSARSDVPMIKAFFDRATFTVTYVVHDPKDSQSRHRGQCAGLRAGLESRASYIKET